MRFLSTVLGFVGAGAPCGPDMTKTPACSTGRSKTPDGTFFSPRGR
jgi:hypothetical protein